jgi:hypothetical protein
LRKHEKGRVKKTAFSKRVDVVQIEPVDRRLPNEITLEFVLKSAQWVWRKQEDL